MAQTYDSITFQYPEGLDENELIPQVLEQLEVVLVAPSGRRYSVPGEAKVGWNWGSQVTVADRERAIARGAKPPRLNLDGLVKWKPGMKETRVRAIGIKRRMV